MNNINVRVFVKKTLGCECPEEVFEYVDCQNEIKINSMVSLKNKMNIGNRLLMMERTMGSISPFNKC